MMNRSQDDNKDLARQLGEMAGIPTEEAQQIADETLNTSSDDDDIQSSADEGASHSNKHP